MERLGGRRTLIVGVTLLAIGVTAPARGDLSEIAKLMASDAAAQDRFGESVAISGNTAVIGADQDHHEGGSQAGSAYVFERVGGVWLETAKLTASDTASGDRFGNSVAIRGDTIFVGAFENDEVADRAGAAYIFARVGDDWEELVKLNAPDSVVLGNFGYAVALDQNTAVISAIGEDTFGWGAGAAYVFERDHGGRDNWGMVSKLLPAHGENGDRFGVAVGISGDTVIIGMHRDNDNGSDSGSAYIFQRDHGGEDNWGEVTKLHASDGVAGDLYGRTVSISGGTAVVGTTGHNFDRGAAYIYERNAGGADAWGQVLELGASDSQINDRFGTAVAVDGDTILVGAESSDDAGSSSGSAYIFRRDFGGDENWGEVQKLTASDAAEGDAFGSTVAFDEDTAVIGTPFQDDEVLGPQAGAAYIFSGAFVEGCPAVITDFIVEKGVPQDGGVSDLVDSDDEFLRTKSELGFSSSEPNVLDLRIGFDACVESPQLLHIVVESRIDNPAGIAGISLRNWPNGSFDLILKHPISFTEERVTIDDIDALNLVNKTTGRIEVSIKHVTIVTFAVSGFRSFFDQVEVRVE